MNRFRCSAVAAAVAAVLSQFASAAPLDPTQYASQGTLNPGADTYVANTSGAAPTLTVGGTTYTGTVVSQGAGQPEIAVFSFTGITLGNGVTITAEGSRPIALLSRGDITLSGTGKIDVSGVNNASGAAGGGTGGIFGFFGTQEPTGPGAGGTSGVGGRGAGGGGFGGAGGSGGYSAASGATSGAAGGAAYGNLSTTLQGGSGGGYTFVASGGNAGGALHLGAVGAIRLADNSAIDARGDAGSTGSFSGGPVLSGGGGSGGGVVLNGGSVQITSTLGVLASGGGDVNQAGAEVGGGGGGGGRVLIAPTTYTFGNDSTHTAVDIRGGLAGMPLNGTTQGRAGATGQYRLTPQTTIVPAGKILSPTSFAPGVSFSSTNYNVSGIVAMSGDHTNAGAVTVNAGGVFAATGTITGGSWTLHGGQISTPVVFQGSDTTLNGYGTLAGPYVGSNSTSALSVSSGTLTAGDANFVLGFYTNGTISVGANATLNALSGQAIQLGSATSLGNGAKLNMPNGANLFSGRVLTANGGVVVSGSFNNQGSVQGPQSGVLTFTGDVRGAGSFTGNIAFTGNYSPGNSPAQVALENATLDPTTTLVMELAGTTAGSEYDQLLVGGSINLAGRLDVDLLSGFAPQLGDSFTLISGGITGEFGLVDLPALGDGLAWQANQSASTYTLSVVAVPEPAGIIIFAGAAVALLRRARRA